MKLVTKPSLVNSTDQWSPLWQDISTSLSILSMGRFNVRHFQDTSFKFAPGKVYVVSYDHH